MMKISKCKKELARIISEHGGWRNGEFAAQDGDGLVGGYGSKPEWNSLVKYWWHEASGGWFLGWFLANKIKNHHQTVLSRAEYLHLYPAQDADGWIEWNGGMKSPVESGVPVDVKTKDGSEHYDQLLGDACWHDNWGDANIIAYRLHKPDVKPEFCESVMRTIPEPEAKPTIDQLLQDWRNADDFAKRKRAEADEAAAMRDELWQAVQDRAGEVGVTVGFVVSVAHNNPELVITDWRDLQLNDIIEYVDGYIKDKIGMTGPVVEFAPDATDGMKVRMKCDNGPNKGRIGWPMKWRFIRRP